MLGEPYAGVFVPAYNVGAFLEETIERIPAPAWELIRGLWIVDDGSRDNTAEVADAIAARRGNVDVCRFERNRGYGAVVRKGIALCQEAGCEAAVCLHGDGQYAPEKLPEMLATMRVSDCDILQGSRIASGTALSGGMPVYKYIAGRMLTALENTVFGLRLTDYHSGYLCYGARAMSAIPFERLSGSFDFDLEVIASARARGMRIAEIPVPTRYAGETSNLNPITYGLRVLRVVARYALGRYRP